MASQTLPAQWRVVDAAQGDMIWGKGLTDGNSPDDNDPCDDANSSACSQPPCPCAGLGNYAAHLMLASLYIVDTPVFYAPPRGPRIEFKVSYSQREAYQPQTFFFSNLGPKWAFDWISYLEDDPTDASALVRLTARGGGHQTYRGLTASVSESQPEVKTQGVLVRTSSSPIRYERRLPDGSIEVFSQADGSIAAPRRIFMTERRDPAGNTLLYTYDAQLRLVSVTDAIGQVTTLSYELPADTSKITKVTDPFGRFASFSYDASGRLTQITDIIGLTSQLAYDTGDFVTSRWCDRHRRDGLYS